MSAVESSGATRVKHNFNGNGDGLDTLAWLELVAHLRHDMAEVVSLKFIVEDASGLPSRDVAARIAAALTGPTRVDIVMRTSQMASIPNVTQSLQSLALVAARATELHVKMTMAMDEYMRIEPAALADVAGALAALGGNPGDDDSAIDESLLKEVSIMAMGALMTPLLTLLARPPARLSKLFLFALDAWGGPPSGVVLPDVLTESSKLTVSPMLLNRLTGVRRPLAELVVLTGPHDPNVTVPIECLGIGTRLHTRVAVRMPSGAPRIAELKTEYWIEFSPQVRWRVGLLNTDVHHGNGANCDCLALQTHHSGTRFRLRDAPDLLVVRLLWYDGMLQEIWERNRFPQVVRKLAEWYPQALAFQLPSPPHTVDLVRTEFRNGQLPTDLKTMVTLAVALAAAARQDPGTVRQIVYTVLLAVHLSPVSGLLALEMALVRAIVLSVAGERMPIDWGLP